MGVRQVNRAPDKRLAEAPGAWDTKCLNCDAALSGHFCARCGQRAVPPYPTVGELASDAFHELSGWDGRFANTFRTLFRRPGQLTVDFLNGRRARYISPMRLYLIASLTFFVAAAAAPNVRPGTGTLLETGGLRIGVFTPQPSIPDTGAASAELTPEEREAALEGIKDSPRWMQPILLRAIENPVGLQHGLLAAMPKALFVLLPIFAGILALFYRGRHYPEHLYFALHVHAFIFLALTVSELSKLTRIFSLAAAAGIVMFVWICFYADFALRRVYGGTGVRTLLKGVGIATLYAIVSVPVLLCLVAWAALRG